MEEHYKCPNQCCTVKIKRYININNDQFDDTHKINRKAGVFIYDPKSEKVLLIQSRGNLWGCPKGTLKPNEKETDCAIREVREETGLEISDSNFTRFVYVRNAVYFYMEMPECEVTIQDHIPENDANGIMWIKHSCLKKLIEQGNISLSKHCMIVFSKFLEYSFPTSTFNFIEKKNQTKS